MPTEKSFPITIARTGTFTDSQGRPQSFSKEDLAAIASAYDPTKLEAPLVFGHPRDADPAYGWVQSLSMAGNTLVAQLASVPDAVRKLVQDGHYRYVSMSLMPDRKRLRHVGLLGAAVPAIDGLGAVSMADHDDGVTVDFTYTGDNEMNLDELQAKVAALETERDALKKQAEDTQKEAAELAAEFAAYKEDITLKSREARLDALVKAGKVTPAERAGCLSFAAALAEVNSPVEFAGADGKTENISAEERYFRELSARPASELGVDFSAFALPAHVAQARVADFNAADLAGKL